MQGFKVTTNPEDLDINVIHAFISQSYWAKNIPKKTLEKAIANSLVFGVYKDSGEQVGFARVTTDKATFAYLADVFVVDDCRGHGLSKLLMDAVKNHPDLKGLRRFMLATRDAHGLYSQYGFESVPNPEILMQIWEPGIYQSSSVSG